VYDGGEQQDWFEIKRMVEIYPNIIGIELSRNF